MNKHAYYQTRNTISFIDKKKISANVDSKYKCLLKIDFNCTLYEMKFYILFQSGKYLVM